MTQPFPQIPPLARKAAPTVTCIPDPEELAGSPGSCRGEEIQGEGKSKAGRSTVALSSVWDKCQMKAGESA